MFVNFGPETQNGILNTFSGVIGDFKWLIIIMIALPLSLKIIEFLIYLLESQREKKN